MTASISPSTVDAIPRTREPDANPIATPKGSRLADSENQHFNQGNTQWIQQQRDRVKTPSSSSISTSFPTTPAIRSASSEVPGQYVWDAEGKRYLDLFPGWGCNILGHSPAPIVKAIQQQVETLIHIPNTWYTEAQGDFAEMLCTRSFGKAFFCNSGAEANEAAIKLTRLHGMTQGKYKIITFEKGFHGRTMATVTATAQPKYHEGLGPMVAGFKYAPYGNLEAVAEQKNGNDYKQEKS